ncbi:6-phospho-3-hexuloisomerase [uncultured Methanospirillum sp.]|uniref:6-phospho-3-hexuloisomerase n=1 Tax=uncultured Methanospirillum sp. TaxID=262503 RepID=UPI0029C6B75C|nr:6-phospho-3-hexuloisomerase [uncultured Methanospirillum sp.]
MDSCIPLQDLMLMMISRIEEVAKSIDQRQVECILTEINRAERIFVLGAGRSGFVAKSFGMRLMHLGLTAYVVGETVTPAFNERDVLIAFSGSGKTKSVLEACQTTHQIGGSLCLITGTKSSPMADLATCVVYLMTDDESIRTGSDHFDLRQLKGEHRSISHPSTPLGTLFETSAMIFADSIISALIELKKCSIDDIIHRYSNMQ